MEQSNAGARPEPGRPGRSLVWIDAREAYVVRWQDGEPAVEHLESDVPAHHKATGHVGHDPSMRHGGGGRQQTAGDPHRLEHLARFLEQVAARIPEADDVMVIGPGPVREHLEREIRNDDEHHHRDRNVVAEPATRLTERQLVARARALTGDLPRRRTVGAYRWSGEMPARTSGAAAGVPGRVAEKPRERVRLETALAEQESVEAADEAQEALEPAEAADGAAGENAR